MACYDVFCIVCLLNVGSLWLHEYILKTWFRLVAKLICQFPPHCSGSWLLTHIVLITINFRCVENVAFPLWLNYDVGCSNRMSSVYYLFKSMLFENVDPTSLFVWQEWLITDNNKCRTTEMCVKIKLLSTNNILAWLNIFLEFVAAEVCSVSVVKE